MLSHHNLVPYLNIIIKVISNSLDGSILPAYWPSLWFSAKVGKSIGEKVAGFK